MYSHAHLSFSLCVPLRYGPEEQHGFVAWIEREQCTEANPEIMLLQENLPEPWDGQGCSTEFSESAEEYSPGELVSVCSGDTNSSSCLIYECKPATPNPARWCAMVGFEPG